MRDSAVPRGKIDIQQGTFRRFEIPLIERMPARLNRTLTKLWYGRA